ncbi:hypothetical protein PM10SUCC1_33470 [Propionigenium maris DSM 9537]|uniref:Uncharacterized protein n=1 Tax=Propionigenium maris DSM 9537 TaxID=1123000 RepID=A0A9W6GMJ3_9FUSO|nr:hypothetical protein [Propionigenium maris]GLI57833.1 hypothetical protein PM10SUCC1_33470 [Propionigenium maris DSM 9537]
MDLKSRIKEVYEKLITVSDLKNNSLDLSLPIFINTGDAVDIRITFKEDKVVLSNLLYRSIEESLDSQYSQLKIRKDYLMNKNKFNKIIQEYLTENKIKHSLKLEKDIDREEYEANLEEIIFSYTFFVTRYYNYIYDYIVANSKAKCREVIFKDEIQNFVINFNKKNRSKKINQVDKKLLSIASKYNDYYNLDNKFVLTGINSKYHLLEALRDLREIVSTQNNSTKKYKKIYVLIDQIGKKELSKEFVKDNLKTFKEIEIEEVYINNPEDVPKIEGRFTS